jgi:hypothetical protein
MKIRLDTSKRRQIRNFQGSEISDMTRLANLRVQKLHPQATLRRGESDVYNCHGLTFASRRTRIEDTSEVLKILSDDNWVEILEMKDVQPGDIVVYFSDIGEANHSGIIVAKPEDSPFPLVCSKWNAGGEYIHGLSYCPDVYGPSVKYYRCRL